MFALTGREMFVKRSKNKTLLCWKLQTSPPRGFTAGAEAWKKIFASRLAYRGSQHSGWLAFIAVISKYNVSMVRWGCLNARRKHLPVRWAVFFSFFLFVPVPLPRTWTPHLDNNSNKQWVWWFFSLFPDPLIPDFAVQLSTTMILRTTHRRIRAHTVRIHLRCMARLSRGFLSFFLSCVLSNVVFILYGLAFCTVILHLLMICIVFFFWSVSLFKYNTKNKKNQ